MFVALPHATFCDWTSHGVTVYWYPILRGVSGLGSSKLLRLFDVHMHILLFPDHALTFILLVALKRGADPPVLFEMECFFQPVPSGPSRATMVQTLSEDLPKAAYAL